MESSSKANLPIPILVVLYDFRYMWKDNREISVKKGEKLYLLEKTNRDWWQVVRPSERKSFFVPAQYVELLSKRKQDGETFSGFTAEDSVLYENLDNLKQQQLTAPPLSRMCKSDYTGTRYGREECGRVVLDIGRQKPVPKTRTKVTTVKNVSDDDDRCDNGESVSPTDFIPGLDPNSSFKQKIDSDKTDKKSNEKNKQEFISNLPQELSVLPDGNKSYRGRSAPVAVENLVYCKVPVDGIKSYNAKQKVKSSGLPNKVNLDTGKNRMKNSYNLKTKPSLSSSESQGPTIPVEKDHHQSGHPVVRNEKLQHFNQAFSKSLEKLAEEIQFEPKKVTSGPKPASPVDNTTKSRPVKMVKDTSEKRVEKKGKSNDASIILDENKIQPQSRSVFSRFRRSLHHSNSFKANNLKKMSKNSSKACELSLSWEGGLDKIQEKKENDEKPMVTPMGLQRSRTFMFAERSPLSVRPANKIFSGKHRLDTAYHSQRKPDEKVTLSTFKPIFNLDVTQGTPAEQKKSPKGTEAKPESNRDKMHGIVSGSVKEKERIKEGNHNEEPKKETVESRSQGEVNRSIRINHPIKLENVTKVYKSAAVPETLLDYRNHPESEALTLYSEPYCSNSESEDNLEEKSLSVIVNKSLRSQSSNDSHLTVSEGTEASESDENSLELTLDSVKPLNRQPVNKRRTSLVRSSRVESSKVRKVAARLPLTPPPDLKPMRDLGDGWGQYISKAGRSFYYNVKTREKNWKPPRKIMAAQDAPLVGSLESVYSDANRSNTSSPLNESCHLSNSLNRSNGSLNSKSAAYLISSYEIPKVRDSGSHWKERSPDDLNRSSYNSSPVTGLSQSSDYSLNKSSRDSLNRLSPIDNIPSEEEGFELHDHVYKDAQGGPNKTKKEDPKREDGGRNSKEGIDTTFRIKPGWEEFYDESLDQIFYMYKDRSEKWVLSFDSEERAYFFEETSKKSLWALPDYSSDNSKSEFPFSIQRSATESAIGNETGVKLRQSKDGDKISRISGSARSSKTQSMLLEPKYDISANNGNKTYSMPRHLSKVFGEIIHVGVLNKTKILDGGKKLRKNWTPAFVVLNESYLFFFKDAKSFQNMKNVLSPSNNHMCLSLQGAVIEKGDKISSRKNVYKISCSDNTDVLIQTDKTGDAEDWFREINTVIQSLPPDPSTANSSPPSDLSSPSKVGRTKSLKVRSKETGSMEDLSSTPEDRQNKIKAKLRKFFIRRPTVDSLKKKGIWKDEPVFGCSLEQITKNRNPRVPIFVEKCIECIESKEENMKTDGLYRASGNLSQVQKIRLEVDQNNLNIMKDEEDVHVLTGSLKLFFRELKEPLIPSKQLEPALLATDKQMRKERIKDFQKIVKSLPTPNHDTLKFLLQHLLRVKEYHKFNRMNINNLAIVFGPTLMWPEQESANMALELMQQNVVIECLLKEFHEIFT